MVDKEKNIPGRRKHEQGMVWGWGVFKALGVQAACSAVVRKEWGGRQALYREESALPTGSVYENTGRTVQWTWYFRKTIRQCYAGRLGVRGKYWQNPRTKWRRALTWENEGTPDSYFKGRPGTRIEVKLSGEHTIPRRADRTRARKVPSS